MLTHEVFESKTEPGEWRVEAIDREGDGECYVAIFSGPQAEARAKSYAALFAIDVESVKRAAVREFARKIASKFGANAQSWSVLANVDSLPAGRELALARSREWLNAADEVTEAAARGANLDEKP